MGLEHHTEQLISGQSSLFGTQSIHGGNVGGNFRVDGSGFISGSGHIQTDYTYATRFFIRNGINDIPFTIKGKKLQLMEGQQVKLVTVRNRDREILDLTILNMNTGIPIKLSNKHDLIDHLDIPENLEKERLILDDDIRDQMLNRAKRKTARLVELRDYVLYSCAGAMLVALICILIRKTGTVIVGIVFIVAVIVTLLVYFSKLASRGAEQSRIRKLPSHEYYYVDNPEFDAELTAIYRFVKMHSRTW